MALRFVDAGHRKPPNPPHSWAVVAGRTLHAVHIPLRPDGSIETGDAAAQTEAALADLDATLRPVSAAATDVAMVQIFLTSLDHKAAMDEAYRRYFPHPMPVRACVAVTALPTPGTVVELVVTAQLPD